MNEHKSADQRARAVRDMTFDHLKSWRVKAKESEPRAWTAFLRARNGKTLREVDSSMDYECWLAFLEGWKRRARAWPFNTATGWVRRVIRGT
jgi:hypothetical protein